MSALSVYKPEYCEIAVKVLSGGESLAAVCAEIGISRKTLYNWRDAHPDFAEALQCGLQIAQRDWENLGRSGIQGDIKNFAGSAWIFTLKNRFRADYADQDALVLANQNERLREELKQLRAELAYEHKKDY